MNEEGYGQAVGRYLIGAVGAVGLTLLSYFAVTDRWFMSVTITALVILLLAVIQLTVQLYAFLHLGADKKPYWKTHSFIFTIISLIIVVAGSLWIMKNLNYRMVMGPDGMNEYMMQQNKEGF